MILVDKIKKSLGFSSETVEHPSATFATRPDSIYAPISGVWWSFRRLTTIPFHPVCLAAATASSPWQRIYAPANGGIASTTVCYHLYLPAHR